MYNILVVRFGLYLIKNNSKLQSLIVNLSEFND